MPRPDEARELSHDDILAVATECQLDGVDAHEIALALWNLSTAFIDFFGPHYHNVHRQAFQTWKRAIVEREATRSQEPPARTATRAASGRISTSPGSLLEGPGPFLFEAQLGGGANTPP